LARQEAKTLGGPKQRALFKAKNPKKGILNFFPFLYKKSFL
jgi:hypothetical protein